MKSISSDPDDIGLRPDRAGRLFCRHLPDAARILPRCRNPRSKPRSPQNPSSRRKPLEEPTQPAEDPELEAHHSRAQEILRDMSWKKKCTS